VETAVRRQLGRHRAPAPLLSIIVLGRKTRVQFSAPIHLRELIDHNKGHERTVRMAQRILRVHFRNLKPR
jgi:glycerol-3-phosphate O-acyltransferase